MQTKSETATDNRIRRVAVDSLGVADACVYRHEQRPPRILGDNERAIAWDDGGIWFALFVKQPGHADWEIIGRRRTRGELLQMVESGPAKAVA